MNTELFEAVKRIVTEAGETILFDPKWFSSYLSDYATKVPLPQKKALIDCLEHNVAQILRNANKAERANCKQELAERLNKNVGMDIVLYKNSIEALAIVLFGKENPPPKAEQSQVIHVDIKQETKKSFEINHRYPSYHPNSPIMFRNIINGQTEIIRFGELSPKSINDRLNNGWVFDYLKSELDGLERFKRIAKDKTNVDPDRIILGYKIKYKRDTTPYVHLYLAAHDKKSAKSLGCWAIDEFSPTKPTICNGKEYKTGVPMSLNNPDLDGLIAKVIGERG